MPTMLENLELEEVSLVDKAANQHAEIVLFKRDTQDITKMTDDEKIKAYMEKNSCTRVEAMKALGMKDENMEKMEKLEKDNESLRKFLLDNGYEITKDGIQKKADEEFIEFEGDKILKSDDRYELAKRLQQAEIEKQEQALLKRAEGELPNLKSEVAVTLLKTADSMQGDDEFAEFLRAVDAMFGKQFEEAGSSDANGDLKTAEDKMNDLVKAYMEEHGISKRDRAKAYAVVAKTDEGKQLVSKIYKGE